MENYLSKVTAKVKFKHHSDKIFKVINCYM